MRCDGVGVSLSALVIKSLFVIQESLRALAGLGSAHAPSSRLLRVARLIRDQVEAAFFMRVLLLHRHVF